MKIKLCREKVLEWANHEDQQDTFVTQPFYEWRLATQFVYTNELDKYEVRKNGENKPLPEVVEEWYREGVEVEE